VKGKRKRNQANKQTRLCLFVLLLSLALLFSRRNARQETGLSKYILDSLKVRAKPTRKGVETAEQPFCKAVRRVVCAD
jgi:hypothetical protein